MKILLIGLLLLSGCTTGSFNPDTNEFNFWSTKEYDSFEMRFKDGDKEVMIKATKVRAFEGQKALGNIIGSAVNPL